MKVMARVCLVGLFLFFGSGLVPGASIAVEHLSSLDRIRVVVNAPVFEPIPGLNRCTVELMLEKMLSDRFRDSGFIVSDDAPSVFQVDISYVNSCDDMVLLVHGQLFESAQLDREWAGDEGSVRVITWQDASLFRASPGTVGDELAETSGLLAVDLIERVQEARASVEQKPLHLQ